MSCSITYQDTSQLSCIFPENVENAYAVFYSPDSGNERMVVNCVRHQELECNNERGFFSKLSAPNRAEITLPDSFKKQYGSFRCDIPQLSPEKVESCKWSPPVLEHPQEYNRGFRTSMQTSEDSSRDSSENSTNQNDSSVTYIGVGIGLSSLIILILIIAIVVFRRTKSRKNRNPEDPDNSSLWSKEASAGAGNKEWVPCISPPRLSQPPTYTEGYYPAEILLSTQQSQLVHTEPPRVFLAGPPGTGKTVVLLLKAIQWLRGGHDVCVVSTGWWSLAACNMLFFLLLQTKKKLQEEKTSTGQLHFLQYNFNDETGEEFEKAVKDLSDAAKGGSLYAIADEARPEKWCTKSSFKMLCDKLIAKVPLLCIWASSYYIRDQTSLYQVEYLTTPFRFPSPVLEEVEQEKSAEVMPYSRSNTLVNPDGPPVKRIHHLNHSEEAIEDCATCGHEVAAFLHRLHDDVVATATSSSSTKPPAGIYWRDVLLLASDKINENLGMIKQLRQEGIPVNVMERDDFINDVATASRDEVWMVNGNNVRGLERKVVVCLMGDNRENVRLCHMARCTSQLVIVDNCSDEETDVRVRAPTMAPTNRIRCFIS